MMKTLDTKKGNSMSQRDVNDEVLVIGNTSIDSVVMSSGDFYKSVCGGNGIHSSMAARTVYDGKVSLMTNIPANFPKKYVDSLIYNDIDLQYTKTCMQSVDYDELFVYQPNGERIDGIYIKGFDELDGKTLSSEQINLMLRESKKDNVYSFMEFRKENPLSLDSISYCHKFKAIHLAPTTYEIHVNATNLDADIITLDPGRYLIGMEYSKVVDLASKVTVFAPSKKELRYIFPSLSVEEGTRRLGQDSNTSVVTKNGEKGSIVYDKESKKIFAVGSYPSDVKDLTGAGDSFCGSLCALLAMEYPLLDSIRMASVVAGKAIETVSATERNKIKLSEVLDKYTCVSIKEIK